MSYYLALFRISLNICYEIMFALGYTFLLKYLSLYEHVKLKSAIRINFIENFELIVNINVRDTFKFI